MTKVELAEAIGVSVDALEQSPSRNPVSPADAERFIEDQKFITARLSPEWEAPCL